MATRSGVSVDSVLGTVVSVAIDDTYAVNEGLPESIEELEPQEVTTLETLFIGVLDMLRNADRDGEGLLVDDVLGRSVLDIDGQLVDEYVPRIERVSDALPVVEIDANGDLLTLFETDDDREL